LYLATLRPDLVRRAVVIGGLTYRPKQVREIIAGWSKDPDANEIAANGKEKAILLHKQFIYMSQLYGDPSFTPDVLSTIRAKTLIIQGDHDFAPVTNALEMYENVPNSYLWIVPNAGHFCFPPYLAPQDERDFISRTMAFLNGDWDKK
jgi:pimeloyl-ACP methyl ester carboxylesterase